MTDDDLPGMWSHADFEGGDPDERSYAQRMQDLATERDRLSHELADYRRRVKAVHAILPAECWTLNSKDLRCTDFIGMQIGTDSRTVFTANMACLPCLIRHVLPSPAASEEERDA